MVLRTKFRDSDVPVVYSFQVGDRKVRILAVNNVLVDRVWLVEKGIIFGPTYVGEIKGWGKDLSFRGETAWQDRKDPPALLYDATGEHRIHHDGLMPPHKEIAMLPLRDWHIQPWSSPAGVEFDDRNWLSGKQPPQMGADGDRTADAWYRSKLHVEESGNYVLQVEGGDRATVFVDGKPGVRVNLHDGEIPLTLSKGEHVLAIFTAHDGRDKLAGFLGDMRDVDSKGLTGAVTLVKGASLKHTIEGWQVSKDGKKDWNDYTIGQDVFNKQQGTAWFRAVLPEPPAGITKGQLIFRSVDENATVYLNGRKLARHEGWNIPFKVSLEGLDTMKRPLELTIFIENYSNEGGIDHPPSSSIPEYKAPAQVSSRDIAPNYVHSPRQSHVPGPWSPPSR